MNTPHESKAWLAGTLASLLVASCATAPVPTNVSAAKPAAAPGEAKPVALAENSRLIFATMKTDNSTEQGASIDGFAYAEKPGDVSLGKVAVTSGVAHVTGTIWPQKGSTWGGIGVTVGASSGGKPMDASAYKTLTLQLAASAPGTLRIRSGPR